jgi:digeranylgeranylglycerophospholipid reductase
MAAKFLAERGHEVLLIEKRPVIGAPVRCGEATGPRKRLADFIDVIDDFIETDLNGVTLYGQGNTKIRVAMPNVGVMLDRLVFDPHCAAQAQKNGAELWLNARALSISDVQDGRRTVIVDYLGERVEIRARVVIGADGVEALSGRWVGLKTRQLPPKTCPAIDLKIPGILGPKEDQDHLVFWQGHDYINDGYIWSFPKMKSQVTNFGAGFITPKLGHASCLDVTKEWLEKLYPGSEIIGVVGGAVPVSGTLEEYTADHFLLVGDAAHHTNPLTGGGIMAGMYSGQIAAEVLHACLKSGDLSHLALKKYEVACWDRFARNHSQEAEVRDYVLGMDPQVQTQFFQLVESYFVRGKWSTFAKFPLFSVKTLLDFRRMLKGRF